MFGWLRRRFAEPLDLLDLDPARERMRPTRIRVYSSSDVAACRELYVLNEPGRFPPGILPEFEATLQSKSALFLVAEKDGRVCGCAGVSVHTDHHYRATLFFGLIHPQYQAQGLGTALLLARLSLLPEDIVLVLLNPVATSRGFYERFNFREYGRYRLPTGEEMPAHYTRFSPDARSQCASLLARAKVVLELGAATVPVVA